MLYIICDPVAQWRLLYDQQVMYDHALIRSKQCFKIVLQQAMFQDCAAGARVYSW